jgi:hypothetical protein
MRSLFSDRSPISVRETMSDFDRKTDPEQSRSGFDRKNRVAAGTMQQTRHVPEIFFRTGQWKKIPVAAVKGAPLF